MATLLTHVAETVSPTRRPSANLRRLREVLATGVYPDGPRTRATHPLWGLLVFVVATGTSLLRLPVSELNTIWAEDGHRFLQNALDNSFGHSLLMPYSGYLHLYPRLVAEGVSHLPLHLAGYLFSTAAAAAVGLAAWSAWSLSAGHLATWPLRVGLAAAVVLVPAGGLEAADNVANSHFFLMFAAFWALVGRRQGALAQALPIVVVILAALSDPVTVVLLPLALGRLFLLPAWRDRWVAVAYLAALALQLSVALSAPRSTAQPPHAVAILFGYALRVVSTTLLSARGTRHVVRVGGGEAIWAFAGVAVVVLIVALVLGRRRLPGVAAGVASLAFFCVSSFFALGGQYPPSGPGATDLYDGSRYTIVPALLLVSAVVLAAQGLVLRAPPRVATLLVVAALLPIATFGVADYHGPFEQRPGPHQWSQEVRNAARQCAGSPSARVVTLPISPGGAWTVAISCGELRRDG